MSAVLLVVLVDGELRDLYQVLVVEVLDRRVSSDPPASSEGSASGGGCDGDEREEEEEDTVRHGWIEWSDFEDFFRMEEIDRKEWWVT